MKEGERGSASPIEPVQYRGFYHDAVVDKVIDDFRKSGNTAVKDIKILGINGVLAKPDIGASGPSAPTLHFLEVKTGFDPKFTPNQAAVYPLICVGWHATSFDPRIIEFGFKMGEPLPPLKITILATLGPGMPITLMDYCSSKLISGGMPWF